MRDARFAKIFNEKIRFGLRLALFNVSNKCGWLSTMDDLQQWIYFPFPLIRSRPER